MAVPPNSLPLFASKENLNFNKLLVVAKIQLHFNECLFIKGLKNCAGKSSLRFLVICENLRRIS
jgi:hypothetical protein